MPPTTRVLDVALPQRQSAFRWGARKTGKSSQVRDRELRPLRAFAQEHRPRATWVVSMEPVERDVGGIRIVPWESFLIRLWAGEIIA